MLRVVPILLCLVLVAGGLCSGLCLVDSPAHSCCHDKSHCGHAAPGMRSHQAVAVSQTVPAIPTQPDLVPALEVAGSISVVQPRFTDFSPPLQTSVLRI